MSRPQLPILGLALPALALALAPAAAAQTVKTQRTAPPPGVIGVGPTDPPPPDGGSGEGGGDRPEGGGGPIVLGSGELPLPDLNSPPTTPGAELGGRDDTAWELWWYHHRYEWLALERQGRLAPRRTPDVGDPPGPLPPPELVHGVLAPALVRALESERDVRLLRQALLALGRLGPDPRPDGRSQRPAIEALLAHGNQLVSEAAILALGLHASPEAAVTLAALANDDEAGRAALGGGRVGERRRALATYALAIAARRSDQPAVALFAAHHLLRAFDHLDSRQLDGQAALVLALGALPTDAPGLDRDGIAARLLALLADDRAPEMARVHAPTALARLLPGLSPEVADRALAALLGSVAPRSKEDDEVRWSALLALGLVGDADEDEGDVAVRRALTWRLHKGEPVERRFAAVALARVAGRGAVVHGLPLDAAHDAAREMTAVLTRGRSRHRPWVGLAVGLLGHALMEQGALLEASAADALLESLRGARSPENSAAYGLGSGLIADRRAASSLEERFDRTNQVFHRSNLALARGFLGDGEAIDALEAEMAASGAFPERYADAALARVMLGDDRVAEQLVADLLEATTAAQVAGSARALAWVGDASTLEPLLRVLGDERRPSAARAAAAGAIGWIGDATTRPWEDPLAPAVNYLYAPPTLTEISGTGVLDML